jgi:hypothetical protein
LLHAVVIGVVFAGVLEEDSFGFGINGHQKITGGKHKKNVLLTIIIIMIQKLYVQNLQLLHRLLL